MIWCLENVLHSSLDQRSVTYDTHPMYHDEAGCPYGAGVCNAHLASTASVIHPWCPLKVPFGAAALLCWGLLAPSVSLQLLYSWHGSRVLIEFVLFFWKRTRTEIKESIVIIILHC